MTLEISQTIVDAILEQSRAEYPDECCGVVLGPVGADKALRLKPMINSAHSPTFYEFDPKICWPCIAKLMTTMKRLS
jgi:[CysO sulfur-carrier protein]-S-L-cysteine hydrolase